MPRTPADDAADAEERAMLAAFHAEFLRQGIDPDRALDLVAEGQRKLRLQAEEALGPVDGDRPPADPG